MNSWIIKFYQFQLGSYLNSYLGLGADIVSSTVLRFDVYKNMK